jgi:hypothetical protein
MTLHPLTSCSAIEGGLRQERPVHDLSQANQEIQSQHRQSHVLANFAPLFS